MPSETEQSTSTTTAPITVRLVGAESASVAAELTARGFAVAEDETVPADCVVVVATNETGSPVVDEGGDAATPVVVSGPDPTVAGVEGVSGFARSGDAAALADQIRWVTARAANGCDPADDRIATLHRGAVSLIEAESEADLFERAVDVASRLLAFDSCCICVAEDGLLVKRAGYGDVTGGSIATDHGVIGEVYRTKTGRLIDESDIEPEVESNQRTRRSGLATPLGDDAVFVTVADQPGAFTERDRELAELLVGYVEGTLTRIRSVAAIEVQRELIESLHEGTTALAEVTTREDAAVVAVGLAEEILAFDSCYVSVREGESVVPYAVSSGVGTDDTQRAACTEGLVEETLRTGESQLVEHRDDDGSCAYQSAVSVPLGDSGVFQATSDDRSAFDETDLELAELLGGHLAGTFSRLAAEASVAVQRERVARLHASTVDLVEADDVTTLYERTVETAQSVLGFDTAYVLVADGEQFTPAAQVTHADHDPIGPVPLDHGVASETYRENRTRLVRDFTDTAGAEPLQSESGGGISVPLGADAVFQAVSRNPGDFDAFDLELAELLVSHAAASKERLRAEAELRGQRDRLGALFENIPDAAVSYELVDDDPYVRAVNSSFEAVFGYESERIVGENLDDFIQPEDGETDGKELNLRLKYGENIRTECRRRTKAGVRTFILQVVPLELGQENVAGFAIYTDITERQERERELRQQNERLDEFANIVSHDLRNPLAIASGYLDLAAENGSPESFERVKEALTRMDRLVEDLLSLARKGQVVGETSTVDVSAVATQAWAGVETRDATLEVDDTLTADADESRLVDLFENLFRNAVEHAGPETTVRVAALDAEGSGSGFAVEDDGPGIPESQRESVFTAGETTGDDGIGYGLTIVNRIVEAHGWSLSVAESSLGGARFEVRY